MPYLIIANDFPKSNMIALIIVTLDYIYWTVNSMIRQNPAFIGHIEVQFAVKIPHNNYRAMLYPLKTFRMN